MNSYLVEPSKSTPAVNFDAASGQLHLAGESYPENSFEFYMPLLAWTQEFLDIVSGPVHLLLHLSYINTGTVKCLLDLFDLLEDAGKDGHDVRILWHYDPANKRAMEMGNELGEDLTIPFELVATESEQ